MQNSPLPRHAALIVIASAFLTGCSMPERIVVQTRIVKPALPLALTTLCAAPVKLPESTLSASQIVPFWARDRVNLKQCAARHAALVEAVK